MRVIYDGIDKSLKVFRSDGALLFRCPAHNDSVADNAWRPDAGCPPGDYTLQAPRFNDLGAPDSPDNPIVAEGAAFVELTGIPGHSAIGIHAGGTCGGSHALDPIQPWCPTENCIRVHNVDLKPFCDAIAGYTPLPIAVIQPLEGE